MEVNSVRFARIMQTLVAHLRNNVSMFMLCLCVYCQGNEPLQSLSDRADMSTGYVKGNDADSTVLPSNNNKVSYSKNVASIN